MSSPSSAATNNHDNETSEEEVPTSSSSDKAQQEEKGEDPKPSEKIGAVAVEDTDDDSEDDDDDDSRLFLSTVVEEEDDDEEAPIETMEKDEDDSAIPLFQYSRLTGSLPRSISGAAAAAEEPEPTTSPPFSVPRTCSVLGKVLLTPETTLSSSDGGGVDASTTAPSSPTSAGGTGADSNSNHFVEPTNVPTELWHNTPIPIAAYGFRNGKVWLVDAVTGLAVAGPDQLVVREHQHGNHSHSRAQQQQHAIVAVSLDASGTFLAALDDGGMCAIFELKYAIQMQSHSSTTSQQQQQQQPRQTPSSSPTATSSPQQRHGGGNVFTNFMSAWTGGGAAARRDSHTNSTADNNDRATTTPHDASDRNNTDENEQLVVVPTLTLASFQVQRISYPSTFGRPTCLAIDPAYRRKREKALMVGFADGKLVLTKRGFVFQRRSDAILYQAVAQTPNSKNNVVVGAEGIQAIAWRGSYVAWADASGVRLLDADALQRIAHVDRPAGARPSLYPTVSHVHPTLLFETSNLLLVAWGDCLLTLHVRETTSTTVAATTTTTTTGATASTTNAAAAAASPGSSTGASELQQATGTAAAAAAPVRRRVHVECTMAWELDCIACGVAPLDAKHLVVLGLVPPMDDDERDEMVASHDHATVGEQPQNQVELQVISRVDGNVVFADMLPLVRRPADDNTSPTKQRRGRRAATAARSVALESTAHYQLLSSFAVPRMDNATELQESRSVEDGGNYGGGGASLFGAGGINKRQFCDSHLAWGLEKIVFEDDDILHGGGGGGPSSSGHFTMDSDAASCDSDNYSLPLHPVTADSMLSSSSTEPPVPPIMVVASAADAVLSRTRDIDDAVSAALERKKPALALHRALQHVRQLRRYRIEDLVNEYLRCLLRVGDNDTTATSNDGGDQPKRLSMRRMKLAAQALPVLLGGSSGAWEHWISELQNLPGALFVVRDSLPVRDPKLRKEVYAEILSTMLEQVDEMREASDTDAVRLAVQVEDQFLNTILAWGTTHTLKDFVNLLEYQSESDESFRSSLEAVLSSLRRRREQTAAVYLSFRSVPSSAGGREVRSASDVGGPTHTQDSLFSIEQVAQMLAPRLSPYLPTLTNDSLNSDSVRLVEPLNSRVALDAAARLCMMKGQFSEALMYLLTIGALHSPRSIEDVEASALSSVSRLEDEDAVPPRSTHSKYSYVVRFIEKYHLHQNILDPQFLPQELDIPPLFALAKLVGLELLATFLLEHCVAPQRRTLSGRKGDDQRRGTLELDIVAAQLEASPQLLHWYLHLIFVKKPGLYVKFPNTASPPSIITDLHRKHLDLHIKYAGVNRDSTKVLRGVETYRVADRSTPLLSFLKGVLPLGGISPVEVGKMLEHERRGGAGVSRTFALELAYIMERYGNDTIDDATLVLELYLKGAQSLMLAVSFAERSTQHSSILWRSLIEFCLGTSTDEKTKDSSTNKKKNGSLFGSLLEAAALSGADLAHLVKQIPHGMAIEGLRPRLVAAVADYRLKLQMHESASAIAVEEKIDLLRERSHRSRRGMMYEMSMQPKVPSWKAATEETVSRRNGSHTGDHTLPRTLRTRERQDRHSLAYSIPIR